MRAPTGAVKAALDKVPGSFRKTVRAALHGQCAGDWSRVEVKKDGSFLVRNGAPARTRPTVKKAPPAAAPVAKAPPPPAVAGAAPSAAPLVAPLPPAQGPAAPAAAPGGPAGPGAALARGKGAAKKKAQQAPAKRPEPPAGLRGQCTYVKDNGARCVIRVANPGDRCALHDGSAFGKKIESTIEPGVRVVLTRSDSLEASRKPAPEQQRPSVKWVPGPNDDVVKDFDWEAVEVETVATRLRALFAKGYPGQFTWFPDVEDLEGVDLDAARAAIQQPDYVQVRPESAAKGYPILGFWRGDVLAVVGMRKPTSPQCIAAYFLSHSMHDTHHVNHGGGTGGKRKVAGLPRTPKQSVAVLRLMGATVDWDELDPNQHAATVHYEGSDLGKMNVAPHTRRDQAESDYQRMIRKMQAINRRKRAAG